MNSLPIIFVPMLFLITSPVFHVVAFGEKTREKSGKPRRSVELEEMDYGWDAIKEQVKKYTREQNEYAAAQGGWLKVYKRQQVNKLRREKISCQVTKEEIIESILKRPHAKLFTEADQSGKVEVYHFKSTTYKGGCYNLKTEYQGRIKSVDTEGKCARLFRGSECDGWSQSMYPGSPIIPDSKVNGVKSIGPCVPNEFEHSLLIKSSPPQLEKLPSALESFANVPDLIADAETRSEDFTFVDTRSNPMNRYLLGAGNRVEALYAGIYPRHLKSPEAAENARVAGLEESFYSKLELGKSDEPGFAIPLELGGPADQIYNAFPQNVKEAVNFKRKIVPWVKKWLTTDNPGAYVMWSLNFVYNNPNTTRPSAFWYWGSNMSQNHEFIEILYGYVPNSE